MQHQLRTAALALAAMLTAACVTPAADPSPTPVGATPSPTVDPAEDVAAFYQGKTIELVIGSSPGGGVDAYGRLIARHLGKHIPGNPTVVPINMPGAGSLIAASTVFNTAPRDGTVIVHFLGALVLQQVTGAEGVEIDARDFYYLGAPTQDNPVCIVRSDTGITDLREAEEREVVFGGIGPGSQTDQIPNILREALGYQIRLVSGYEGTGNVRLAVESGEVMGACFNWDSIKATWTDLVNTDAIRPIAQGTESALPDMPDVPLMRDLADDTDSRRLIDVGITNPAQFNRPFALPPGVPAERAAALRAAFAAALEDPELLAEAEAQNLIINPVPGERLETGIGEVLDTPAGIVDRLQRALSGQQ